MCIFFLQLERLKHFADFDNSALPASGHPLAMHETLHASIQDSPSLDLMGFVCIFLASCKHVVHWIQYCQLGRCVEAGHGQLRCAETSTPTTHWAWPVTIDVPETSTPTTHV